MIEVKNKDLLCLFIFNIVLGFVVLQATTGKDESQSHLSLKPTQEVSRMPAQWTLIKHRH